MEDLSVAFYPTTTASALREHRTSELVVHAVAVALKTTPGDRCVPVAGLVAALDELGIFRSRAYVMQLLERGERIFWEVADGRVWLFGSARVAQLLGAGRPAYRQVVNTARLRTRAGRRAVLTSVWLPDDCPISQRAVRAGTGVSERTQLRYRKAGHFQATRQYADLTGVANADLVRGFGRATRNLRRAWAKDARAFGVFTSPEGDRIFKQLPNIYRTKDERIPSGRRTRDMFGARTPAYGTEGTTVHPKAFFDSPHQFARYRGPKLGMPGHASERSLNLSYSRRSRPERRPWYGISARWEAIPALGC